MLASPHRSVLEDTTASSSLRAMPLMVVVSLLPWSPVILALAWSFSFGTVTYSQPTRVPLLVLPPTLAYTAKEAEKCTTLGSMREPMVALCAVAFWMKYHTLYFTPLVAVKPVIAPPEVMGYALPSLVMGLAASTTCT